MYKKNTASMKIHQLRHLIREELDSIGSEPKKLWENINEYTVDDIFKKLQNGERVGVSSDGGNSYKIFEPWSWDETGDKHIRDFKNTIYITYQNEVFTQDDFETKKGYFTLKGSSSEAPRKFYDELKTPYRGGIWKGD